MTKDRPISVRLEPDEREAIEQAARDDDRKVSALVRKIVVEWLKRNKRLPKNVSRERVPVAAKYRRVKT